MDQELTTGADEPTTGGGQPTTGSGEPASGGPGRRTVGVALLAGAIGLAAFAVAFAAGSGTPAQPAAQEAPAVGAPVISTTAGWTAPSGRQAGSFDGRGGPGEGWGRQGNATISITAIDGSKLSLQTDNSWTRTIDATGATVTKDGKTVTTSALVVGDRIAFSETRNADGTYKITAIQVVQPTVSGTVASVSGSTVTVTTRDGGTQKVVLTGSTTYQVGGQAGTKDAVVAGAVIMARGTLASDGTLTAAAVTVAPATAAGTVKEKGAGSITLTLRDGSTVVVKVTSATTYHVAGIISSTLADVAVGATVTASGTKNADGSLTATIVRSRAAGQDGGPGMGGWGRGGHGRGMGGWDDDGMPGWPGGPDASPAPSIAPSSGSTNG